LLLISRPLINFYLAKCLPDKKVPRLFGNGEPVPYGVAIAGAFLMVIWMEILPGFQF
jgi:hypothetical protein